MPPEVFFAELAFSCVGESESVRIVRPRDGRSRRYLAIGICQSLQYSTEHFHGGFRLNLLSVPRRIDWRRWYGGLVSGRFDLGNEAGILRWVWW